MTESKKTILKATTFWVCTVCQALHKGFLYGFLINAESKPTMELKIIPT